jgi:hypothetical protein
MRKYLLLAVLAAGTLATGCKPKDPVIVPPVTPDSKVAFTLEGEGFTTDYRFQMNDVTAQEVAAYEPSSGYLQPIMSGVTKDGKYQIELNGQWEVNSPTTITFNDKNSLEILVDPGDTTAVTLTSKMNQGTVTITKFGAVGETIEGTFKGIFTSSGGGDISVKDGRFILKRDQDI